MNFRFLLFLFTLFFCFFSTAILGKILPVFAQSLSSGIAYYIDISDKNVKPGDIIRFTNKNYHLSRIEYDPSAYAVVTDNPAIAIDDQTTSANSYAVVSSGQVYVLVSSKNGTIKPGDLITPSSIPGIGEKATQDGYVIGTALDSYDAANPQAIGKILVNLNFGYFSDTTNGKENLLLTVKQAFSSAYLSPVTVVRYILAALIIIVSFGFGIGFFGRVITTGIEALGRNPLASRVITLNIVFNLILLLITLGVGIVIAYFILVF